jgi:hypothetical protein
MNDGLFTYYDIFANAGSGYILLIIFWVSMIGFWRFLTMDADK